MVRGTLAFKLEDGYVADDSTGHKGVDVRQTANRVILRALLQDAEGAIVDDTSTNATLAIYEQQDDGDLYALDFNDHLFNDEDTARTTPTVEMTYRTVDGGSNTDTGLWTYALSNVSDFDDGGIYYAHIYHADAVPTDQIREFQWGSVQGDLTVEASGSNDLLNVHNQLVEDELFDIQSEDDGATYNENLHSLKAIYELLQSYILTAIPGAITVSGTGIIADAVTFIRQLTDEPSTQAKYSDGDILKFYQASMEQIMTDLQTNTEHPVVCRQTISVVKGTTEYALPPCVGEVHRLAKIKTATGEVEAEWYPGTYVGRPGFKVEDRILRFDPIPTATQDYELLYVPTAEATVFKATATFSETLTSSALNKVNFTSGNVSAGSEDKRHDAYNGHLLRVLDVNGDDTIHEYKITDYDYDSNRIITVDRSFSPALVDSESVTFEVVPNYALLLHHVVCYQAALTIVGIEGNLQKLQGLQLQYREKIRALRLRTHRRSMRFGGYADSYTLDNERTYCLIG